jgi:phosphate-selective porin
MRRAVVPGFALACLVAAPARAAAQGAHGPTLSGVLQLRETYQADTGLTATVHLARLYVDGFISEHFIYRVSADLVDGGSATVQAHVALADAYVRWKPSTPWAVTMGQFKTPFSREYLLQPGALELADRAAIAESLPPKRDIGVMAAYAWGQKAAISAGAFNGEGTNRVSNTDSTVLVVARMTVHPVKPLDLGVNVAAYSSDSTRYGVDGMFVSGPGIARVELIEQHHASGSRDDYGWYVLGAYWVAPHVQIVLRQEDFWRRALAIAGPRDIATTGGANLETNDRRVRLTMEYVSRQVAAARSGLVLAQLQLSF